MSYFYLQDDDERVTLAALKRRLIIVRAAQTSGKRLLITKGTATGTLISEEWIKESLETRALRLEAILVQRIGVKGLKYKVVRESQLIEIFTVDALDKEDAIREVKSNNKDPEEENKVILNYEAKEVEDERL